MKKLGFYAVVVIALVFTLWFCTKDGLQPDKSAAPQDGEVGCVTIESRSMDKKVRVESEEDIKSLSGTLSTLTEENGMMVDLTEDFPEYMKDWTIEWMSPDGESQAVVEISSAGTVFRGDQCFNFLGGEIFDMDYLRGLLLGLPESREPRDILQVDSITYAYLCAGDKNSVGLESGDLDQLKEMLGTASFCEDEAPESSENRIALTGENYRELGTIFLYGNRIKFGDYVFSIEGDGFTDEWLEYMGRPRLCHEEDILDFSISTEGKTVRITDPELLERLEGGIREMEFKEDGQPQGEAESFYINRYYADGYYDFAIFVIDEETIRYGSTMYKITGDKKLDIDLYTQLLDPNGPYKGHPGVEYWKEGDPPMSEVTPRPQPTAGADHEPEGTPPVEVKEEEMPKEKAFDLGDGYAIMEGHRGGGRVVIRGEEYEKLAAELRGLRFVFREECGEEAYWNHATDADLTLFHGDQLFTFKCYDTDGYMREEFTARNIFGWIDYHGGFYEAEEGGLDLDALWRMSDELPEPEWYESSPIERVRDEISGAKSLWITDPEDTWAAVITDPELLERINQDLLDKEFFAEHGEYPMEDPYTYELEWYRNVLGPYGSGGFLDILWIKDKYSIRGGYKLREGEIDMELIAELCKPDGKYSDRDGVKFVRLKDLVPEEYREDNTE